MAHKIFVHIQSVIWTLFSAFLLSLTLSNEFFLWGVGGLGFFALVPLFMIIYTTKSMKSVLVYSFIWGVAITFFSRSWLYAFEDFGMVTLVGVASIIGGQTAIVGWVLYQGRSLKPWHRMFFSVAVWTSLEYLKTVGFLGDPWGLVAYTVHSASWLTQIVDIAGVSALTFLVVLGNAVLVEIALRRIGEDVRQNYQLAGFFGLIFFTFMTYGIIRYHTPMVGQSEVSLILAQQNMNSWQTQWLEMLSKHMYAVDSVDRQFMPDLIVSSETVLLGDYKDILALGKFLPEHRPFREFLRDHGVNQLYGGFFRTDEGYSHNSTLLLSPEGELIESYHTRQLVPFAESIPFLDIPFVYWFMKEIVGYAGSYDVGKKATLFQTPLHSGEMLYFTTPICFEDAFASMAREFTLMGSQLFINLTNDSWSQMLSAQMQHLVLARFRTIETRRGMARATNSGMTVFIDVKGDIIEMLEPFETGALAITVPIYDGEITLYTRLGDWFAHLMLLLGALYVLLIWRTESKPIFLYNRLIYKDY
jgi:apolipoprotein N-acyltransferase